MFEEKHKKLWRDKQTVNDLRIKVNIKKNEDSRSKELNFWDFT